MDPRTLADHAMEEAAERFDAAVERLIADADGDAAALSAAANLLSARTQGADSPEHVAFTYLAAAFRRVADRGGDGDG